MKALRYALFSFPFLGAPAFADDYQIDSPQVDQGEVSVEANINYSADNNKNLDRYVSQLYGVGYGVTSYWQTELIGEVEKSSVLSTQLTVARWENIFAPFKPGEYWVDTGFRFEFDKAIDKHLPNNAEASLLLEKRFGDFINTANISFDRNFGPNAASGVDSSFAWRTKCHVNDWFKPGVEYYSDIGKVNLDDDFKKQDNVLGPVIQGHFGDVNYDTGVLFGISPSAHDVTFKLNLEYDF